MYFANYLVFGLIAVAIFTAYMAVVIALRKDKNQTRTAKILSNLPDIDDVNGGLDNFSLVIKKMLLSFGVDVDTQTDSANKLAKAGFDSNKSVVYFVFFQRVIQPVLLIIGFLILAKLLIYDFNRIKDHSALFLSGLLLVVIGGFGANLFLANSAAKRSKELLNSFPDALDLILICVESGLGIDAAFARVCKEMKDTHPVAASEFERTRFEMTMMNDRVRALQNFSDRTALGAVRSLVSSLIQAEKFGTSLIDTIRMIAEEQRTDRMMNAETKAARLPALITMPLIFFILPALFMIILGPVVVRVSQQGGIFGGQ